MPASGDRCDMTRPRSVLIYCLCANASQRSSPGVCRTSVSFVLHKVCLVWRHLEQSRVTAVTSVKTKYNKMSEPFYQKKTGQTQLLFGLAVQSQYANPGTSKQEQTHQCCINMKSLSLNKGWLLGRNTVNGDAPVE